MAAQLSPRVKELIEKARIVSFDGWQGQFGEDAIASFQAADDKRAYLDDSTLAGMPAGDIARALRDHSTVIVDAARSQVLDQFPGIIEPGGGLYPAVRAEACWRDFWQFLRCISYGIAAQRTDYTNSMGLHYMGELYQELQVPLDAMVYGLQSLKTASRKQLNLALNDNRVNPYFDHLIQSLSQFYATD